MSDPSLHPTLIAKVFENNDALRGAVDGQIVPNFRRTQADSYLSKTHQTCVGVRNAQRITDPLPGIYFHGGNTKDQLIEISVISIGTDEVYADSIVEMIEDLLKAGLRITYGGVEYAATVRYLRFAPLDDDQFQDRVQIIGTCRLMYLDS